MTPSRLLFACLLPLAVSACGVPDLIAHGVKEYDRSRNGGSQVRTQPAAATSRQAAPQPAVMREEPPVVTAAPVAPRESVTVETLPPPR